MTARFEYHPAPDLGRPLTERLGQYPRQPDPVYDTLRAIGRRLAVGITRLLYPLEVIGTPPEEPRLALLANHSSHLDSLAVLAALPRPRQGCLAVLAAADYFFARWHRALIASLFGQGVAFDRTHYTELRRWTNILRAQERGWLLVYPSGSRRRAEAQRALLLVLAKSGWPLVPVRIEGTREAWPVGRRLPRLRRRLRVTFGDPLHVEARDLPDRLEAFWAPHDRTSAKEGQP